MTYIYYANKYTDAGKTLHQKLCSAFGKSWMKRCRTFAEFSKRLHGPLHDVSAVVLLISNRKEWEAVLSVKDILWDIKVIIIFSSHADISQVEILALRPRFLTWTDSDLSNVVDVLGNIMKYESGRKFATETSPESNTIKIEDKGVSSDGTDSSGR